MDSTANILQFCRLCLVKDGVNIPIFDEQGDIRQIYLKISSCLPVKVAREDHLPKKICDGCSNKLDNFYDFWRTSAESEKQLLAWLGATGKDAAQVNVKEEDNFDEPLASDISKNDDDENKCYMFEQKVEEGPPVEINDEPPPSKRPRRTAAVKAAIAMDQNSDDDGDSGEPITKMEDDSDETDGDDREPAFVDVPSTSADDQPGPSGVSKDGSDAPSISCLGKYTSCCGKVFKTKSISDHRKTHEHEKRPCEECGKILSTHRLKLHMAKVHKRSANVCVICKKSFSSVSDLQTHVELSHINIRKPHQCKFCDKDFERKDSLTEHIKVIHEGFRYNCSDCGKVMKSRTHAIEHAKIHEKDYVKKTFKCNLCEASMGTTHGYKKHMLLHENKNQFVCEACGKTFSMKSNLTVHMRTHTGEKPFECETCGKGFPTKLNLQNHHRTHTKEKPFQCTICSTNFTQKGTLKVHMRHHTGERPHACPCCNKKFITKTALKGHSCKGVL